MKVFEMIPFGALHELTLKIDINTNRKILIYIYNFFLNISYLPLSTLSNNETWINNKMYIETMKKGKFRQTLLKCLCIHR